MVKRRVNKKIAVMLALLLLLGFMFIIIFYIIPGIIKDVLEILYNANDYSARITGYVGKIGYEGMPSYLKSAIDISIVKVKNIIVGYLNGFFNSLIDFSMELPTYILTPVFVYYFLNDTDYFTRMVKSVFPVRIRDKAVELWVNIDVLLSSFVRSQLILSLVISILTFIAMIILRVKYPLIIAFINGITNIIPYFGPVIGFLPAFFAALGDSVNKAIMVSAAFFIIQQFESSVIAPKLIGDSMGIHPVIIMIIILLGGNYFGGWGLLFSVPLAGMVKVVYTYTMRNLY
jgi:predicted PurR-regulated permease PerM